MMVFLFGLFLQCINLINSSTEPIPVSYLILHLYYCTLPPDLLTSGFIWLIWLSFIFIASYLSHDLGTRHTPWYLFMLLSYSAIWGNSGYMHSVDGDMRYMVYIWGFPYLDYSLYVLISWIHRWARTTVFGHICLWYITWCLISCSCVYAHVTIFNTCFSSRFYRYTCVCLFVPLGTHFNTRYLVFWPPRPACPDLVAWAEVDSSAKDQAYLAKHDDQLIAKRKNNQRV